MKKIITIILFLVAVNFSQAQVTIGKVESHEEKTSLPVIKPYDSLSDYTYNNGSKESEIQGIKRYIGCQFYLPPIQTLSGQRKFVNTYYTMIDFNSNKWEVLLLNENRKDSLWIKEDGLKRKFILVPYFVKLQKLYKGKELICVSSSWQYEADIKTRKTIEYGDRKTNVKWTCDDITLLPTLIKKESSEEANKRDRHYSIKEDSSQYKIYFILKNDKNETMAIESSNIYFTNNAPLSGSYTMAEYLKNNYQDNTFMTTDVAKKIVEQANEKTQQQNTEYKQKQEKRREECIKKYGEHYGNLVSQGKTEIGMTTKMCGDALGVPKGIHTTETATGVKGYIVYPLMTLFFENGKVVRINKDLGGY